MGGFVKFTAVTSKIPPTEIVGQNEHDVGPSRLGAGKQADTATKKEKAPRDS
jgi:hypothetical protein